MENWMNVALPDPSGPTFSISVLKPFPQGVELLTMQWTSSAMCRFVTENDAVGSFFPPQKSRADLFNYIESELLAIEPLMIDARQNEYARADKAAVWMLLAKMYLNAEVYTGTGK
jgi:hypothetical protein